MAGLPTDVLTRAKQISKNLESLNQKLDINSLKSLPVEKQENKTMSEIYRIIKDIDPNRLSPMAAFEILVDLTNKAKEEK